MIERIIDLSARHRYLVVVTTGILIVLALFCVKRIPVDAIPDLSETQVIIYSRWDRSPDIIEDQVTYPIVSAMLGAPKVKAVRGYTDFGFSFVYLIFEEGTDLYWARSRTMEYLSKIQGRLPESVQPELGPDATGVGWVYQYALVDKSGHHDLAELRSFQDWTLRYWLQSVPGVAEVASIGGFQKQYQINVDPNILSTYRIPLPHVIEAIRDGNNDVGGRVLEMSGREYMVRGRGYAKSIADLENIVLLRSTKGAPVLIKDVARVTLGPQMRRGLADLDGQGDAVGGIIVMRQGQNALKVIQAVKAKLAATASALPAGIEIVPTYDRSQLITSSLHTLTGELVMEMIIVSAVILLFLWHFPSAVVPILTIPISVLLAFIPMYFMGMTSNIMSLSGIAISIGVLVDGAIVEVENAYKRLEQWNEAGRHGNSYDVRLRALKEVGPSVVFSLLVIAVAFIPVFTLVDQEGRLFKPLALSKTFAMAIAALLAMTLDPAVRMMFTQGEFLHLRPRWLEQWVNRLAVGTYYPEGTHPISRALFRIYEPACRFVLKHKRATVGSALALVIFTVPIYFMLGSEFMPPLYEGNLLFMPSTLPGIALSEAQKLLQTQDRVLRNFPEVERVFGKVGRADTATDPAPLSMIETTVLLKPTEEWRAVKRWYSWLPYPLTRPLSRVWPDHIAKDELISEMDNALKIPGVRNAWTMPIKGRVDMLATGIRTPVGIKILGPDRTTIEKIGGQVEMALRRVPGTRTVVAERSTGGYYLDFTLKREQLARYGISIKEAEMVIGTAIGGESITTTFEGRERYSVNVRYPRALRDNLSKLKRVLVPTSSGAHVPLAYLADIEYTLGPSMIRNEDGMPVGYVYVDMAGSNLGGYVDAAKRLVLKEVQLPAGYTLVWSGQYENILRVRERLMWVVPFVLLLIFLLLLLNTKSIVKASIVMLAVPFSLVGAIWYLYLLGYNTSVGVGVGIIALMGLDAETGVFMLLFLDLAFDEAVRRNRMRTLADLTDAIVEGAVKRVRPKMMTVCAAFMGLLPLMWSVGLGADMMKRVAAPMIGGLVTSFILELLVYPPLYAIWKEHILHLSSKPTNPS